MKDNYKTPEYIRKATKNYYQRKKENTEEYEKFLARKREYNKLYHQRKKAEKLKLKEMTIQSSKPSDSLKLDKLHE